MIYDLKYFIEKNAVLTGGPCEEDAVSGYEEILGFKFPTEYSNFISEYSFLEYEERTVLGVSSDNSKSVVNLTALLKNDLKDFPSGMIAVEVLEKSGDFVLMDEAGGIYKYSGEGLSKVFESFEAYVISDILDGDCVEISERFLALSELLCEENSVSYELLAAINERLILLYGSAMMIAYRFDRRELDHITDEIFEIEKRLHLTSKEELTELNNDLNSYLSAYLNVVKQIDLIEYTYIDKYMLAQMSEYDAQSEENQQILNEILLILKNIERKINNKENNEMVEDITIESVTETTEPAPAAEEIKEPICENDGIDVAAILSEVVKKIDLLQTTFDEKIAEDEHKNKLFDNVHKELTKYQNGLMDKLVDSIAMDIIQLIDSTKRNIEVYSDKEANEENYQKLLKSVKGIAEDLEDILYRQDIEPYSVPGDEVDVRRQKIIQIIDTEDETLDNKVAQRTAVGYTKGDKIMRPERIKIYKVSKKAEG